MRLVVARSEAYAREVSAASLWKALADYYDHQIQQQRQQLEDQFHDCNLPEGGDAGEWITKLSRLAEEIRACGGVLDFHAYRAKVFSAMPPSWRIAKLTLTGQTTLNDEISLNAKIRSMYYAMESDKQADRKISIDNSSTPYTARSGQVEGGGKSSSFGRGGAQMRGRGRWQGGRNRKIGGNSSMKFNGECHYCHRDGHKASDCRLKKRNNESGGDERNGLVRRAKEAHITEDTPYTPRSAIVVRKVNTARVLSSVSADSPGEWCIDSGASFHMINNLHQINHAEELQQPIKIQTAKNEGKLQATHKGSVKVKLLGDFELQLPVVYYVKHLNGNLLSVHSLLEQGTNKML